MGERELGGWVRGDGVGGLWYNYNRLMDKSYLYINLTGLITLTGVCACVY